MIYVRSEEEIEKIARSCGVVSSVLQRLKEVIRPGVTTAELDAVAEEWILSRGGIPSFKGYLGYPASLCTSINDEIVHGIPSHERSLKEGDIVGIDCGALVDGYHGDAAYTYAVGKIDDEARRLLKVTEEALYKGLRQAKSGNRLYDISSAIQKHVEQAGFSIVREFVGHGIGKMLHEEPAIPNFGEPGTGIRLVKGFVIAIEPMVNAGKGNARILTDGWTAKSADGSLSAHFEHTVVVDDDGGRILTRHPH